MLIFLLHCFAVFICSFWDGWLLEKGYLTEVLMDKMKYLRNAKQWPMKQPRSNIDEVGGTGSEWKRDEGEAESVVKKPRKELKQYLQSPAAPLFPPGEDSASSRTHLKMLQQEERKVFPDKKVISELMRRMYTFRRQEILE